MAAGTLVLLAVSGNGSAIDPLPNPTTETTCFTVPTVNVLPPSIEPALLPWTIECAFSAQETYYDYATSYTDAVVPTILACVAGEGHVEPCQESRKHLPWEITSSIYDEIVVYYGYEHEEIFDNIEKLGQEPSSRDIVPGPEVGWQDVASVPPMAYGIAQGMAYGLMGPGSILCGWITGEGPYCPGNIVPPPFSPSDFEVPWMNPLAPLPLEETYGMRPPLPPNPIPDSSPV